MFHASPTAANLEPSGIGVILTFFVPSPDLDDPEMTNVAAPLHGAAPKSDKEKEAEEGNVSD